MMLSESPEKASIRKKMGLSLLEAARSRYESLQISDDLFGESGEDSSGNPFYSTSPDSRSSGEGGSSEDDDGAYGEDQPSFAEADVGRQIGFGLLSDQTGCASRPETVDFKPERHSKSQGRNRAKKKEKSEDAGLPAAKAGDHPLDEGDMGHRGDHPCQEAHPRLDPIEEEGWTHTLQEVPSPSFKETSGPTCKMLSTSSAVDFFQLFVPDNVIKNMVTQTNMYAKKYQERFGRDEVWVDVTLTEVKAFLGYIISTSTHHCESVLSIWSGGFYSNKSIALTMTQSRFEKILKFFHIVAFRSSQTTHGLYKIQPFLNALQNGFDSYFRPSQTQVLHEPLIDEDPIFIATCTERELRKRKKRKFSLWVRQCSSTGFICQIYVHLKEGSGADGLDTLKHKPQLHSMVAKNLCQNASGKNYIIFTGPSITSLNLFEEFEKQGL